MKNPAYDKFVTEFVDSVYLNVMTPYGRAVNKASGGLAVGNPTPQSLCVHCGELCEAAAGKPGDKPQPGAVSICGFCGGLMLFDEQLHLRKPTPEEAEEIAAQSDVQALLAELKRQRPKAEELTNAILRHIRADPTRDPQPPQPKGRRA